VDDCLAVPAGPGRAGGSASASPVRRRGGRWRRARPSVPRSSSPC